MCEMMCNNPKLDLVNINAYTKFGEILSFCENEIQNEIQTSIKGHNSMTNVVVVFVFNVNDKCV